MKKLVMAVSVLLVCSVLMPVASYAQFHIRTSRDPKPQPIPMVTFDEKTTNAFMHALVTDDVEEIKRLGLGDFSQIRGRGILLSDKPEDPTLVQFTPLLFEAIAANAEKIISYWAEKKEQDRFAIQACHERLHDYVMFGDDTRIDDEGPLINARAFAVSKGNKNIVDILTPQGPLGEMGRDCVGAQVYAHNKILIRDLWQNPNEPQQELFTKSVEGFGSERMKKQLELMMPAKYIRGERANSYSDAYVVYKNPYFGTKPEEIAAPKEQEYFQPHQSGIPMDVLNGSHEIEGSKVVSQKAIETTTQKAVQQTLRTPSALPNVTPMLRPSMPRPPMPRH
ncbi:MAG: hypothetical protein IKP06_03760 [Elusimicrobiaceae bacterium]|nr:hypothetical protein [Elusimicrobiaceae bacterium]